MTDNLPEARQLELLRRISEVGDERQRTQAEMKRLSAELRELCIEAARAGVNRRRIREVGHLSSNTTHAWFSQADVPKRPRKSSLPKKPKDQGSGP